MGIRTLEGLIDISAILRPGVFILWHNGRVTYIGKAKCLLMGIAVQRTLNHSNFPSWVPLHRMVFDRIEIIPCDTVRAVALQRALIDLHNPIHNRTPKPTLDSVFVPPTSPPQNVRRL